MRCGALDEKRDAATGQKNPAFGAPERLIGCVATLARIRSCEGLKTANPAYGGAGGHDLYITEADSGRILRAQLPTPGHVLLSHI